MGRTTQTYDILTRLAVGNSALVYRAVDKTTQRQVALKLLVQDGNVDHQFDMEALLADAPRLRQITGAHVCQLLDAYPDDDGPVLVYEFANGISGAELPAQRKLEAAQVLDVAAQLISALRSGERQKCPHGDVKPSNIVFMDLADKRPFALVLDWGLTAYRTDTADDSLPYLAPERLAGAAASHRADLFSAGAVLFFFCTGKTLVAGTGSTTLQDAWQNTRPALLAELRPDLPAKFVHWLCSLLELAPEKRPESAVDALAALAALNPPPPPVPPESFRPRPASKIAALPFASGIVKPPPLAQTKPVSAIRQPPPASAVAKPIAKPAAAPAKNSHVAMTIGLFGFLALLIAGTVWFLFFRNAETKTPDEEYAASPRNAIAARTPAPSVGESIGKKFTPPPLTPAPIAKPASPPKSKSTATPTPKSAPKPAPPASNPSTPLIAGDSFDYPGQKMLDGLNGGDGWAGPWKGPLAAVESGAGLVLPATEREATSSRALGPLEKFTDPAKGGTWYFACLLQHGSDLPVPGGDIQINPYNGDDVHDLVRIVATDSGGELQLTLNNEKNPLVVKDTSKPVLVVLRTTLKNPKLGNWDLVAELFVNPQLGAQWPPAGARTIEVKLNYVRLPQQLGLLIRKPRSEATTRISTIRFCQRHTELSVAPQAKR